MNGTGATACASDRSCQEFWHWRRGPQDHTHSPSSLMARNSPRTTGSGNQRNGNQGAPRVLPPSCITSLGDKIDPGLTRFADRCWFEGAVWPRKPVDGPGSEIDQARIDQVRGLKFDGWRKMATQSPDEPSSDHQTTYPAVFPEPEWYRGAGLDLFGLAGGVCSPVRRRRDIIEDLAWSLCAGVPSQHLIRRGARPGLKFPCRNNSPRRSPRGLTWG